ncbi:MAG: VPDSG-CTERM sorting domain-containing protein [Opitutaceae bacterium]|nr:VPDSG-CTERM sorting domain-containing protein [Opitutaceae bacterium]
MMKLLKLLTLLATLGVGVSAFALPTNITVNGSGTLLNTIGIANASQYGQGNNDPGSNLTFLNGLIGNWNGAFNPDLPTNPTLALQQDSLNNATSYNALTGYEYVVFHFGAGQAGGQQVSPGGWWQAYYLGGAGGSFGLPSVGGENVGGYSSARYFGVTPTSGPKVPDSGATLGLLSLGLVGLALVRRRRSTR